MQVALDCELPRFEQREDVVVAGLGDFSQTSPIRRAGARSAKLKFGVMNGPA